jgi:predicted ATPase
MQGHLAVAASHFFMGEFEDSIRHFDETIALYDLDEHGDLAFSYGGLDSRMTATAYSAIALWALGHVDRAVERSDQVLAFGAMASHPYIGVRALNWDSQIRQFIGDRDAVLERADAAFAQAEEKGFVLVQAQASVMQGWVQSVNGQASEGLPLMRRGLEAWTKTGAVFTSPYFYSLIADACLHAGQPADGIATIDGALAYVEKSLERSVGADLHRLKGELLLQQDGPDAASEAEACFHKALDVAQSQGALSFELRAAISLARYRQSLGNAKDEAFDRLVSVYGKFTEGFGTADLIAAKDLLATLNGDVSIAV